MVTFKSCVCACLVGAAGAAASAGGAFAQLDRAVQIAQQATDQGIQNQNQVEDLDDQRSNLSREYRAILQQIDSQALFVDQQRVFLRSQQNEVESLEEQISRVDSVKVELLPMMREMVSNLEEFIQLDLPFQMADRLDRIERLKDTLDDPEITEAERYRVILNAYEIETSYGRGIDAYEGVLTEGDNDTVDFLRFGRLMLVYRSKSGDEVGYWDQSSRSWQTLEGDYNLELQKAFRVANDAAAPEILLGPVPGPVQGEASQAAFEPPATPEPEEEAPAPAAPPQPPAEVTPPPAAPVGDDAEAAEEAEE